MQMKYNDLNEAPSPGDEALDQSNAPKHPENATTYKLRFANWIERITSFSEDKIIASANKIAISTSKVLKPLANKPGPNKFIITPPSNTEEGTFYETLRWEVKDNIKYRMYSVEKPKDQSLEGNSSDKVLSAVLGGVKLPTISFATDIKYNPEYLQQYNLLLGSMNKVIIANNKFMADSNKSNSEIAKSLGDKALSSVNTNKSSNKKVNAKSSTNNASMVKDNQSAAVQDKSVPSSPKSITQQNTTSEIGSENTANVTRQEVLTASFVFNEIMNSLNEVNDSTGTLGSKIGIDKAISGIGSSASNAISKLRNIGVRLTGLSTPGIYNAIGYDFGYTGSGTRVSTPKVFRKMSMRNVSSMLQFIENSHVYEDASGKLAKPQAGKKSDMHQIKPVKLIMYRLPKADLFKNLKQDSDIINDESLSSDEIKKLGDDEKVITNTLQLLPAGTLAVAFWGRIIQMDDIDRVSPGDKQVPTEVLLTNKTKPEWYFFIPAIKKIDVKGPVEEIRALSVITKEDKDVATVSSSKTPTVEKNAESAITNDMDASLKAAAKTDSKKAIKTAFNKLAQDAHPDKGGSTSGFIKLKEDSDKLISAAKLESKDEQSIFNNIMNYII
jgi:hypothetical protein